MMEDSIKEKCRINTNRDADVFVGIKCESGDVSIHFPLGFRLAKDEDGLRKDILLLIRTIAATTAKKESEVLGEEKIHHDTAFPIQAYMYLITDYLNRGIYKERETGYGIGKKGKIDWNRTVKTQRPYVQDCSPFYLEFSVRKNSIKENELITLIHEYCVYESFAKIGWLFTGSMPAKPRLTYNQKLFRQTIKEKLRRTFNDRNKILFQNMAAVINYLGNKDGQKNYKYGTYHFEYVWEALIDKAYGIYGKEEYFPKSGWYIDGKVYGNACLKPDTIMLYGGDVYVLDAKYYKYGVTKRISDLPGTSSVNKQITYGEYIAKQDRFRKLHGDGFGIYNAFLMPYDSGGNGGAMVRIGEACGDWKGNQNTYERVQGILVDMKYLMKTGAMAAEAEIARMAEVIRGETAAKKRIYY